MAVLCMGKNVNRHFSQNFEFFWYYFLSLTGNAFIMLSQMRILDYLFMDTNLTPPPEKFFRGEIIQGEWRNFHRPCALFLAGVEFHIFPRIMVCFLVEFDLLFTFGVLSFANSGLCLFVYLIHSWTRSLKLWDVNRGNSCIWLHFLISFQSRNKRSVISDWILFGVGRRVLWGQGP